MKQHKHHLLRPSLAIIVVILLLSIFWLISPLQAAPPTLEMEIKPQAVTLAPNKTEQISIVVRNQSDQTVTDLQLNWLPNEYILISDTTSSPTVILHPHQETTWNLEIRAKDNTPLTTIAYFHLDYLWKESAVSESQETPTSPVSRVTLGELTITVPPPDPANEVAEIAINSTSTSLNEQRPGLLYLVVKNKTGEPVQLTTVTSQTPAYISIGTDTTVFPLIISPYGTSAISFTVEASDTVQPGKSLLLFESSLIWEQDGQEYQSTLITSHEIEVNVFGESQILSVMAVPTLLLLPGFLMITSFYFLWRWGKTKEERDTFPLEVNSSVFWLASITLSLTMVYIYRLYYGRDYLEAYGFDDIMRLWFISIMLGGFFYGLQLVVRKAIELVQKARQWRERRRTPTEKDTPLQALEKLARRNLNIKRGVYSFEVNGRGFDGLLLQITTTEEFWVSPKILITYPDDEEELERAVTSLVDKNESIQQFLKLTTKKSIQLAWDKENWPSSNLVGPIKLAQSDIKATKKPIPIFIW